MIFGEAILLCTLAALPLIAARHERGIIDDLTLRGKGRSLTSNLHHGEYFDESSPSDEDWYDEDMDEDDVDEPTCSDVPDWYDIDGQQFDCDWYASTQSCESIGNNYENFGHTANSACCACGGGWSENDKLNAIIAELQQQNVLLEESNKELLESNEALTNEVEEALYTANSAGCVQLNKENNYSKIGNRRSCAWDRCPSDGFNWLIGDCECKNGINQCYLEGEPTTIERFDTATLKLTDNEGVWKMEATGKELLLGQGSDTASGSACFDDPLRGGFRIDLSDTKYEFAEGSVVAVTGWSLKMRMVVDGTRLDDVSTNAASGTDQLVIPSGTRVVEAVCGGWGGGCTSELFVQEAK